MSVSETMTPWRRAMILATVTTTTATMAMTVTVANVSLPQIQGSLSATQDQIAWVITFNIVATAVCTPMTGWLVSRFGQRRVMLFGLLGFTLATAMCGFATSLGELVIYRVIQGAMGAPLIPLSQAIVLDSYPQRRHGFATSVFGMGVVMGPIFAPTIGGYVSELYSWRWVFFMVLPVATLCFIAALVFVRDRGASTRVRLDWTGLLALCTAIACLQLMLDRGERNDWFDSLEILIEAAVALLAFYIFVVHSLTTRTPFLSGALLRDRNFMLGLGITLIFGMLNFTPMVLFPSMLQDLQDYPDSIIGGLLGARGLGTLLGFIILYFGSGLDPRIWLLLGFGAQAGAGFWATQFPIGVPTLDVAWVSALQGLGSGLLWVPITLVTFATLGPQYRPEGMSIFHLLRNIGGSIHVSLSVAVVIHTARINYAELAEFITPYREMLSLPSVTGVFAIATERDLLVLSGEMNRQAAMVGYKNAFFIYTLTALLALPMAALVRFKRPGTAG